MADTTAKLTPVQAAAYARVAGFIKNVRGLDAKVLNYRVFVAAQDEVLDLTVRTYNAGTNTEETLVIIPEIDELETAWNTLVAATGVTARTAIFPLTTQVPGQSVGTTSVRTLGVALPLFEQMLKIVEEAFPDSPETTTDKGHGFPWGRLAAAVGAVGVAGLAAWYFFIRDPAPRARRREGGYLPAHHASEVESEWRL